MKIKPFIILFILLSLFLVAPLAQAESLGGLINEEFDNVQKGVTGSTTAQDLDNVVLGIIDIVLGLLGIIFVILIIWSGFQWMTAGGNSDAITTAKKRLINAIIGLIIILAAYSIAHFVITQIYDATRR